MRTKRKRKKWIVFVVFIVFVFWRIPQLNHVFLHFFYGIGLEAVDSVTKHNIGFGAADSAAKYDAEKPVKLDSSETKEALYKLSKQYPEFQPVYEKREEYPEELLSSLCNTPEMIDFVDGYLTAEKKASGKLTKKELSEGIPLLLQWDKRWGYASYGNSNIGLSGCAPTCLSMVIVGLTGEEDATPYKLAKFAEENGYYLEGTGTTWSIMTEGVSFFGITGQEIPLSKDRVLSCLNNNNPIICSMKPGDFTTEGHFVVLSGTEDGKIKVNDPNSRARSKAWDYETLEGQIKNLWAFCKD